MQLLHRPTLCALLLGSSVLLTSGASAAQSAPTAAPAPAISEADTTAFGEQLAGQFEDGSPEEVVAQLDTFAFLDRVTVGLGYGADEERDFRAGVLKSLPASLAKQMAQFTSAKFVRVQTVGTERRALLRLVADSGAANYMAFVVTRRGTGPVRWCDAFTYLTGEKISETMRRTLLPLVAESKKGVLERLTQSESEFVRSFKILQRAAQLMNQGDAEKAWAECEKLPAAVKKDRTVLLLRMRTAQALDEPRYLKVIEDWEAAFPNDATLDFISIDGDVMRKEYAKGLKHIEAFAKRIGGDAYLDFLAANMLFLDGHHAEARARARRALQQEPMLTSAYDTLLSISVKTKNHQETVAVLDELKKVYPGIKLEDIIADEGYAEFKASDVYRDWPTRKEFAAPKKE